MTTSRRAGFTLVELLVVTAIISILMGIGSAFFTHFDRKLILQTTAGEIGTLVKMAQNFARQEQSHVNLYISLDKGFAEVWGGKTTGCWHGEDLATTGAFGRDALVEGVSLIGGKTGKALQFTGGNSKMDCGPISRLSLGSGFVLSFWIYPQRGPQEKQTVCQVGVLYNLVVTADYSLAVEYGDRTFRAATLPLYQWSHVELHSDRQLLTLAVNDCPVITHPAPYHAVGDGQLLFGKKFHGRLDEIKWAALVPIESYSLPTGIVFAQGAGYLRFDPNGLLDPLHHGGPETIILEGKVLQQLQRITITVSMMGQVEIH